MFPDLTMAENAMGVCRLINSGSKEALFRLRDFLSQDFVLHDTKSAMDN
jgi:hypothetical protein